MRLALHDGEKVRYLVLTDFITEVGWCVWSTKAWRTKSSAISVSVRWWTEKRVHFRFQASSITDENQWQTYSQCSNKVMYVHLVLYSPQEPFYPTSSLEPTDKTKNMQCHGGINACLSIHFFSSLATSNKQTKYVKHVCQQEKRDPHVLFPTQPLFPFSTQNFQKQQHLAHAFD